MSFASLLEDVTPTFLYLLLTATIGPLLFGYHLAELNAPQEVITCVKKDITPGPPLTTKANLPQCIPMNPAQFGLVSSFFTLGGLIGALTGGPVTSRYGRLRAMIIAAVFATIGPVLEALTPNIGIFAAGRLISGLGAGAATVIVPIYISEIAPPHQKGFFGTFTQVMVNIGILITQVLGLFLSRGSFWRIILAVGGALALTQGVGLVMGGQESPKWLVDSGRPAEARRILRRIRGNEANVSEEISAWGLESERDVDDEEQTLLTNEDRMHRHSSNAGEGDSNAGQDGQDDHLEPAKASRAVSQPTKILGFLAVLQNPKSRPAVIAVVMVMLAQQLCGINSIVMYGVTLLSDLLAANSAILNVTVSALNVMVTMISAPLVEKAGRKTCLLGSIAGMGTSSILLAFGIMRHVPILSAVSVVLFVASFGLGLGPIPFILSSELVGAEAIGAVQSWALAANWIATFVVAQFFPVLNDALGKGQVYFIFAGFALFFGLFIAWWVPETKGKKDADEVWGRTKSLDRQN